MKFDCQWLGNTQYGVWKIEDLLATIKTEVEAREAVNVNRGPLNRTNVTQRSLNPMANSFYAGNHLPNCVYCEGNHYPLACTTIKDVKERCAALLRAGHCFNCLKLRHRARNCDSVKKCKYCHKKHHQSICDRTTQSSNISSQHKEPTETTAVTSNTAKGGKLVLLQTAHALASSDPSGRSVNV